ncbi:hypothetical protein J6590_047508 [Homalodisca vitripennis]|nr:hypothetical protein J6590_047508 [Homalodisca vitripennis]
MRDNGLALAAHQLLHGCSSFSPFIHNKIVEMFPKPFKTPMVARSDANTPASFFGTAGRANFETSRRSSLARYECEILVVFGRRLPSHSRCGHRPVDEVVNQYSTIACRDPSLTLIDVVAAALGKQREPNGQWLDTRKWSPAIAAFSPVTGEPCDVVITKMDCLSTREPAEGSKFPVRFGVPRPPFPALQADDFSVICTRVA